MYKLPWRGVLDRKADSDDWRRAHGYNIGNACVLDFSIMDAISEDAKEKLEIDRDNILLDVGCATGRVTFELSEHVKKAVGTDFSQKMIERAKREYKKDNLAFEVCPAHELPFPDNSFDRLLCYSVFLYFPDLDYTKEVLNEFIRVTKPNGIILVGDITDVDKKEQFYSSMGRYKPRRIRYRNKIMRNLSKIKILKYGYRFVRYTLLHKEREEGLSTFYFKRDFFTDYFKTTNHRCTILEQNIKNRNWFRFDVKIIKGDKN